MDLISGMVEFAKEVRKLLIGSNFWGTRSETSLELKFSTRTLIRWAKLTVKFQPLARQGVSPINYALDRVIALRASPKSRIFFYELSQRLCNTQSSINS
jgi:cobaltochelatase CobS